MNPTDREYLEKKAKGPVICNKCGMEWPAVPFACCGTAEFHRKEDLNDLLAKKRALQREYEDICQRIRTNDWELKQLQKGREE